MIYVSIPKDLSRVKTKVAFNLTKRQLICFSIAGAIGIPLYFATRNILGKEAGTVLMILVMIPLFLAAVYEKDGMPFEKYVYYIVRQKFLVPKIRIYKTQNIYSSLEERRKIAKEVAYLEKRNRINKTGERKACKTKKAGKNKEK